MIITLELMEKEFLIVSFFLNQEKISYALTHTSISKLVNVKRKDLLGIKTKLEELTLCITSDFFYTNSSVLEKNNPIHSYEFNYDDVVGVIHFSNNIAKKIISKIEEATECQKNKKK
jgi:hypothetical protein